MDDRRNGSRANVIVTREHNRMDWQGCWADSSSPWALKVLTLPRALTAE